MRYHMFTGLRRASLLSTSFFLLHRAPSLSRRRKLVLGNARNWLRAESPVAILRHATCKIKRIYLSPAPGRLGRLYAKRVRFLLFQRREEAQIEYIKYN